MKKKCSSVYASVILTLVTLLTFPLTCLAQEVKKNLDMVTLGQIPYGFSTAEGELKGAFYEILNEIMVVSKIGNANNILPFKRVLARIRADKKFCTIAANDDDNTPLFDLVEPIGFKMVTGVLPAPTIELNDYSNLKGISIAVPLGAFISDKFNNDNTLIKVSSSKYDNAIKMLKSDRVDAVAGSIPALMYITKKQGIDKNYFGKPLLLQSFDVYLLCSYGLSPEVRSSLKKTLIELKSKGKVQQILNDYF